MALPVILAFLCSSAMLVTWAACGKERGTNLDISSDQILLSQNLRWQVTLFTYNSGTKNH